MTKTQKNAVSKNTVSPRRDSNGKFVSNRIKVGALYGLTRGKTSVIVRAQKFTRNNLILVNFNKMLWAIVPPSLLQNLSKETVNQYLNS